MRYLFLCCYLFISPLCRAQNWKFFGFFPAISQSGSLGQKLQYNLFVSATYDTYRLNMDMGKYPATALQYYLQPSLSYKITPALQIGLGYAYVKHNLFGLRVNENRLWAQAVVTHAVPQLGRLKLSHRMRYEERYPLNTRTRQWSYAQLFRYQVGFTYPLYNPKETLKGWYATASNEFFLCLSGAKNSPISAKNAFYGEDWVYTGIGYNTGKFGKIELGYCYQNLIRNPAQDHRYLHLLQATWAANFDLSEIGVWLYTP
ncbi:DUF2490 domain-containing protein [Spirosoma montaniterrae]|uniref:DUF2490 domain-containing protein n=1 Tax=Spirosoma montaniterrae TaxID=1178516 RepID=A0A1P9WYP3_9BACT|nr:DUF2490 domain-containing protein [Spirosoma montaniterrae]AQG80500.1 hypothetical protein AWR27_14915 [Spirosoma montaniterrae]